MAKKYRVEGGCQCCMTCLYECPANDRDGVKIDFADGWVHLRKSNTEPIIRVYSEAATMEEADELAKKVIDVVWAVVG